MEKIHFISYGDEKYNIAKQRIYNEAKKKKDNVSYER